jgi:hypothetical protein
VRGGRKQKRGQVQFLKSGILKLDLTPFFLLARTLGAQKNPDQAVSRRPGFQGHLSYRAIRWTKFPRITNEA